MLLLIDNQQAQIVKADGFGKQRMGANGNLDVAGSKISLDLFGISGACHTRQHPDTNRKAGKTLLKQLAMLAGQQCRRRNKRYLIAAHCRNKGSAQGHFRLAKADITTNQPVRGTTGCKVTHHIFDGGKLVICFGEAKTRTELGK